MAWISNEAVKIAQAEFDKHQPAVVVGSSRGSAFAMNLDSGEAKLVLLCPAWKKYGAARGDVEGVWRGKMTNPLQKYEVCTALRAKAWASGALTGLG